MRILVIDDSESILAVLEEALAYWGHDVLAASGGDEGLEMYKRHCIDAVVCDLTMPGISGIQVAQEIRTNCHEHGRPKTPFVLLTGWSDETDIIGGLSEHGIDHVLEKPANLRELVQVLSKLDKGARDQCHPCPKTSVSKG